MSDKETTRKPEGERAALEKIEAMPEPYRAMGERLHALIMGAAPALQPALWYGMPAYRKDGAVILFFRADEYMTFGLTEKANLALEEDAPHQLRPSSWFFNTLDEATEAALEAIVRRAAS